MIPSTGPEDKTDMHSSADDVSPVDEDWELVPFVKRSDSALKIIRGYEKHQNRADVLYGSC